MERLKMKLNSLYLVDHSLFILTQNADKMGFVIFASLFGFFPCFWGLEHVIASSYRVQIQLLPRFWTFSCKACVKRKITITITIAITIAIAITITITITIPITITITVTVTITIAEETSYLVFSCRDKARS